MISVLIDSIEWLEISLTIFFNNKTSSPSSRSSSTYELLSSPEKFIEWFWGYELSKHLPSHFEIIGSKKKLCIASLLMAVFVILSCSIKAVKPYEIVYSYVCSEAFFEKESGFKW